MAGPEIALEHWTLDVDYFRMTFPRELSIESVNDLEAYLNILLTRLQRRVVKAPA